MARICPTDEQVLNLIQPGEVLPGKTIAQRLGKSCHIYRVIGSLRRLQEAGQVEQVQVGRGAVFELAYRRTA